jgi:hypothetical protein
MPCVVRTLKTKFKITADSEAGKQAVITHVEADLRCNKSSLKWRILIVSSLSLETGCKQNTTE